MKKREWSSPENADTGVRIAYDPAEDEVILSGWYDDACGLGDFRISRATLWDALGWDWE